LAYRQFGSLIDKILPFLAQFCYSCFYMDIYLISTVALIIFSIIVILYIRISAKNALSSGSSDESKDGADFTILE
jgi:hypothetical protein